VSRSCAYCSYQYGCPDGGCPQDEIDRLRAEVERLTTARDEAIEMRDAIAEAKTPAVECLRAGVRSDRRRFPIQTQQGSAPHPTSIPWAIADEAYSIYSAKYGRDQSLERLAERGGFGPDEMDTFLPGWRARVRAHDVNLRWVAERVAVAVRRAVADATKPYNERDVLDAVLKEDP
jgi:hypothetical protein